ncbi:MAG: 50S ribosomal protein L22 [Desulfomonilaceae bacterium]
MEWEAKLSHAHISARKARMVADLVRGLQVGAALSTLRFTPKKGAGIIRKALQSALDNASKSSGVNEDNLYVSKIMVDEGPTAKRWMPRAMGRATRIRKRTSHISIALQEK